MRRSKKKSEVKGFLEAVRPLWVSGWAYTVDESQPVTVRLWIDDTLRAEMKADQLREKMRDLAIHPTGRCGFIFQLDQLGIQLPDKCVVRVTAGDSDHEIWQSPWPYWSEDARPKGRSDDQEEPRSPLGDQFFFIHIPKTAGTSFGDMLLNVFPEDQIFANRHDKKDNNTFFPSHNDYLLLPQEKLESVRLLVGHVPFAIGEILPRTFHRLTFLRNPRDRVISHLAFAHEHFPVVKGQSIEQLFHQVKRGQLTNAQVVYFADSDPYDLQYFKRQAPIDEQAVRQAVLNIHKCEFVGIVEEFETAVRVIEAMFGWKLGQIPFKNKSSTRAKVNIPQHILDEIDEITRLDQIVYEAARQRFQHLKETFLK